MRMAFALATDLPVDNAGLDTSSVSRGLAVMVIGIIKLRGSCIHSSCNSPMSLKLKVHMMSFLSGATIRLMGRSVQTGAANAFETMRKLMRATPVGNPVAQVTSRQSMGQCANARMQRLRN